MSQGLLRDVTDDERLAFRRDGVVYLRDIIAPEVIEQVRSAIEAQRENPSPYATVVDAPDLYLLIDQFPSLSNEGLRKVALGTGGEIAKQLLRGLSVRWLFDQLFYKGSGQVAETPWHQDTPYGYVDGKNVVRVWMPVDPIPRETTLEVVRGSHQWNVEYNVIERIDVLEDNADNRSDGKFNYGDLQADNRPRIPDIEAQRDSFDILGHAVNPGDVVAFDYNILHHAGAGLNPDNKRRAFAVVYGDELTPIKRRPNPVPGALEASGVTDYRDGQTLAEFPRVFPLV